MEKKAFENQANKVVNTYLQDEGKDNISADLRHELDLLVKELMKVLMDAASVERVLERMETKERKARKQEPANQGRRKRFSIEEDQALNSVYSEKRNFTPKGCIKREVMRFAQKQYFPKRKISSLTARASVLGLTRRKTR